MNSKKLARAKNTAKSLPHPKDRKVDQFQRKLRRDTKLSIQQETRKNEDVVRCARFFWFRTQARILRPHEFSENGVSALARLFIDRNDFEVSELQQQRNPQRGRIRHLEAIKQREEDEFASAAGFAMPDVQSVDGRTILTEVWDGELSTIGCVPVMRAHPQPGTRAACDELRLRLKSADDVRHEQVESTKTPLRLQRFCSSKNTKRLADRTSTRKQSVKSSGSIAERSEERRSKLVLRSKTEAHRRRHAAISESRGLLK